MAESYFLLKELLSSNSHFCVSKALIKAVGLVEANLLAVLCDVEQYSITNGYIQNGWFLAKAENIMGLLNIKRSPFDSAVASLIKNNLIEKRLIGIPAKTHYKLNYDNISSILFASLSKSDKQDCQIPANTFIKDNIINSEREYNKDNNLTLFQEVKEKEKEENNYLVIFDSFRRTYRGTKRGNEVEFKNFVKKHADWKEILPKLLDMYKSQCALLDERARRNLFVPQPKNLQTYINQRCWEEEITLEDYGNDTRKNQSRTQYGNAWCEFDQRLRAAANGQQDASLGAITSIL